MKKLLSTALVVVLIAVSVLTAACGTGTDEVLYVYNWKDYIDPEVLEGEDGFEAWYEAETGKSIKVVYTTYDTNETMMTKVERSNSKIDVICPSEYAIEKLITDGSGYLLDLSVPSVWENAGFEDVDADYWEDRLWGGMNEVIKDRVDDIFGDLELSKYFSPYMFGTLGILYNKTKVSEEAVREAGFSILFNPPEELKGKVYMKDSSRDTYAATVLYLRESGNLPEAYKDYTVEELINCVEEDLVSAAETALKKQKNDGIIAGYSVDLDKEFIIEGSAYAGLAWSGDALYAIGENPDLAYYAPEGGTNVWFDGWCVTKNCQNVRAALMFMLFMKDPVNAVKNMLEVGYVSAVSSFDIMESAEARELLEEAIADGLFISGIDEDGTIEDFFADPMRYPEDYSNLGVMRDFGENNGRMVNMLKNIKAEGDFPWVLVGIIGGVVLLLAVAYFVYRSVSGSKNKRQKA